MTPSPSHQHDAMLLHIMPFPGDITSDRPPTAQPHPGHLPLGRIRLLRLEVVHHAQTHALHVRPVDQRGRHGVAGALGLPGLPEHLHQGRAQGGRGREGAEGDGVVGFWEESGGGGAEERGEEEGEAVEGGFGRWWHFGGGGR